MDQPLWQPSPARIESARLTDFRRQATARFGTVFADYAALHRWSVEHPEQFWWLLWGFAGVIAESRGETLLADPDRMPGARFFPDARLNFAENLLRRRDDATAMVFRGENGTRRALTHSALYDLVSRIARALEAAGIRAGDRVADGRGLRSLGRASARR